VQTALAEVRDDLQRYKTGRESVLHEFGVFKTDLNDLRSDFVRLNSAVDVLARDTRGLKTALAKLSGEVQTGFAESVVDTEGVKTGLAKVSGEIGTGLARLGTEAGGLKTVFDKCGADVGRLKIGAKRCLGMLAHSPLGSMTYVLT
jgi:hypothetical protein